jgi:hypothetical protein
MAVKTNKAGSIKALRASTERRGGGNEAFLQRIPADDSITVRFLTEPEEWQAYFEHYDQVMNYYPCSDNCPGCTEGNRPSQKYLANALRVEDDRVIPLVINKSLVTKLLNSYDRYGTMMDRDYELIRIGSGLDTDYDRSPEVPIKRNTKGVQMLDLVEVLENQLRRAFDDDDLANPASTNGSKTKSRHGGPQKSKPGPVVEHDDEDEDDESSIWNKVTRDDLEDMSLRELRIFAKSELGIAQADIRGLDQDSLIDLILDRAEDSKKDSDDADDEDMDQEDTTAEEGEAAEGDDVDEDDEDELSEDDVRAMSLPELRKLCGQLEIPWKRTDGKALLIKKVLESVGDDEDEDDDDPPF